MSRPNKALSEFAPIIPLLIEAIKNKSGLKPTEICRIMADEMGAPFTNVRRNWYRWSAPIGGPIPTIDDLLTIFEVCLYNNWISDEFQAANANFFEFLLRELRRRHAFNMADEELNAIDINSMESLEDALKERFSPYSRHHVESLYLHLDSLDPEHEFLRPLADILAKDIVAKTISKAYVGSVSRYSAVLRSMATILSEGALELEEELAKIEKEMKMPTEEDISDAALRKPFFSDPHKL